MWWLYICKDDLKIERQQLLDEGKDISSVEDEFKELLELDLDKDLSLQPRINEFFKKLGNLPARPDYIYVEPSDLDEIKANRPEGARKFNLSLDDEALYDRFLGAWLGRCSGCLLGKPVEGWKADMMWSFLKDLGQYPLNDYFTSDLPKHITDKYDIYNGMYPRAFINTVNCMPEDDDTNYTVVGLALLKKHGSSFTSRDVLDFWLWNIPIFRTATAERIAYKNYANLIEPPLSAIHRNPYREWIGAQIRADFFGYAALGNPELAAEMAFRDASISHIKNGIYGEMWVAAMLASAVSVDDPKELIKVGLTEVPKKSRFTEAINKVLDWYDEGIDYEEALRRIHTLWDDHDTHHWCHVISNAQIVAMGLLWGEKAV